MLRVGVVLRIEQVDARVGAIDQLLCLPEPLTPANGFSCSSAWSPYRGATRFSVSIMSIWWSLAMWLVSKSGAISYWPGATSLCRVLTGTPRR